MSEQIIEEQKDLELLLNSIDDAEDKSPTESDRQLIRSRLSVLISSPFIEQYKLDTLDLDIIALLLSDFLKGYDGTKSRDLLKSLGKSESTMLEWIKRMLRLEKLGIIEEEERRSESGRGIAGLLRSEIRLSSDIVNRVFNEIDPLETPVAKAEPYKDNFEYLSDQFERVRIMEDIADANSRDRRRYRNESCELEEELNKQESKIARRLKASAEVPFARPLIAKRDAKGTSKVTGIGFPFERLKVYKNLSQNEELIVLALLRSEHNNSGDFFDIKHFIGDISRNQYERFLNINICRNGGSLEKKGLIEACPDRFDNDSVRLKEKIRLYILGEKKLKKAERDSFFERIKPSVTLDNVILPPETTEKLNMILKTVDAGALKRLKDWDIKGYNLINYNNNKKARQGLNILFYGVPGTGKTLAAHALAHEFNKEILTLDCSKVLGKYVGESEKNIRMVFDRYKEIATEMKIPPVLLLNEADQFLHVRLTETSRSVDQMYNQMQNIILEQIERFEGILIATTNQVGNLDSAFSRRFHHKIEFKRPEASERLKLWRLHLPAKAPLSEDVDLEFLAESYSFSGGQIAMVVQNAVIKAAIKGDIIRHEDFVTCCEDEMKGNFDEKAIKAVGF